MSDLGKARIKQQLEADRVRRAEIWKMFASGVSQTKIAKDLGVTPQNISQIVTRAEADLKAEAEGNANTPKT